MHNTIEIDLNAILHNITAIKSAIDQETKLIGVVKANAYGHGLVETARTIWTGGADILAVNSLEEAVALRVNKIKAPILILSYVEPSEFRKILDFDLTLTVYDLNQIRHLSKEAQKQNKWAKVDVKIDTGMGRYGFDRDVFLDAFEKIVASEHIKIEGIHSHFASAGDDVFSRNQIDVMRGALFSLQQHSISAPIVHMAASEATFRYPEAHFDAVRVGLGLYGYYGFEADNLPELKAPLKLKSKIAQIRAISRGDSIGYDRDFIADKDMEVAVVPIGYFDGYSRSLSNKSEVLIFGKRCKILGRVCMNILMVDVTSMKCVSGDEVVLIGDQKGEFIGADELSKLSGTIVNETLCRLGEHIPREYHFK
ncbi:MAG: Alanine racemase [candidate division WS2 bacterium ADurb.Bin280]|uniref:Alanine racemase n=1 Tax=candidate division WS2 bacterium ADurb.Bin280 TaxID=1852829 RepID=A0A1V5SEU2_9BACT|nr:MAG: Alanine racemase [candidate division WS2 bacterium ADurb.Bin280]